MTKSLFHSGPAVGNFGINPDAVDWAGGGRAYMLVDADVGAELAAAWEAAYNGPAGPRRPVVVEFRTYTGRPGLYRYRRGLLASIAALENDDYSVGLKAVELGGVGAAK